MSRTAAITGSASGIGLAAVQRLPEDDIVDVMMFPWSDGTRHNARATAIPLGANS